LKNGYECLSYVVKTSDPILNQLIIVYSIIL